MSIAKKTLLTWHRRIALAAGMFLLLQGLSGGVLVWREELLQLSFPSAAGGHGLPPALDTIVFRASAANLGNQVARLDLPQGQGPVVVRSGERLMTFSPSSGALLSDRPILTYPSEVIYLWHTHMLSGKAGSWFVTASGVALLLLVITGPWFWWPGRSRVRRALKVSWSGSARRTIIDLHRVVGVFLAALFAISATTGITLTLMSPPRSPSTPSLDASAAKAPLMPLGTMLPIIRATTGNRAIRSLRFPASNRALVRLIVAPANGPQWSHDEVWFDRAQGRVISLQIGRLQAADWIAPVHDGGLLGLFGRCLVMLIGIALALMSGSGLWIWLRRRRTRA